MNKEIRGILCEIIFVCTIMVTSIIVCPMLVEANMKETQNIMKYANNLTINIKENNNYYLYPMTDEYAQNNLETNVIEIVNLDKKEKEYNLYLKVDKSSTMNIDNLKFSFNGNINKLNELYEYEDDNYTYYKVFDNKIENKDYINYIFWLDADSKMNSTNLIYNFEII